MKIVQINSVCGIGSTGRIATDLNDVIIENGGTGLIVYGRDTAVGNADSYRIGEKTDVLLHVSLNRLTDRHGIYSKGPTKTLVEKIKEFDPDVIHLHNIHGYYLNLKILFDYLKTARKPVVWTLHDCWAFTGHCAQFDYVGCDKWKNGCFSCPQKSEYPASLLADCSQKNYAMKKELFCGVENLVIVTPSHWLKSLVEQSFLKEYPIQVIHNGVDLLRFHPFESAVAEDLEAEKKKIVLGVATAWSKKKGLSDFMKLSRKLPSNYRMILVGLEKDTIRDLPNNVIGLERTNNVEELAALYTAADVYVNMTYEDTFPTTNLEAMACGTPVITYRTGGSPESVGEGCGYVVDKGNVRQVFEKIKQIVFQKSESYKTACTEHVQKNFDKRECYLGYWKLYEQLTSVDEEINAV